jgi:hypothetical protein
MSDEPRDVAEIIGDSQDLYERKNEDYGDSWRAIGVMLEAYFEHQGADEITIPTDADHLNSFGLFFRRLDKISRELNGWFLTDDFEVDESIVETHTDDIPYSAMHAALAESVEADDSPFPSIDPAGFEVVTDVDSTVDMVDTGTVTEEFTFTGFSTEEETEPNWGIGYNGERE